MKSSDKELREALRDAQVLIDRYVPTREHPTSVLIGELLASADEPQAEPQQPNLHPRTADLVDRFSLALKEKLAAAEIKYGYSDGWAEDDWMTECRARLLDHIEKGDPRDVAAYCAFLWHHGESTTPQHAPEPQQPVAWMHCYRQIGGGAKYEQAVVGDADHFQHPEPTKGFEWYKRVPLVYAAPQHAAVQVDELRAALRDCVDTLCSEDVTWMRRPDLRALVGRIEALLADRQQGEKS